MPESPESRSLFSGGPPLLCCWLSGDGVLVNVLRNSLSTSLGLGVVGDMGLRVPARLRDALPFSRGSVVGVDEYLQRC